MHLLKFLGTIFGFIGWETLWIYFAYREDSPEKDNSPFVLGAYGGILSLMLLSILALICWGIWNIT